MELWRCICVQKRSPFHQEDHLISWISYSRDNNDHVWIFLYVLNDLNVYLFSATKDYLNCIEVAANATCGSKAAQFQHNLLRKGVVFELDDVDCDLGTFYL